ncbi:unnamed protein product [Lactuca virosa]|uniref:RRM domain-containing protein n=1 Tax=Lactuca virosa TaxID=75947 RepID=A0AAU9PMT9_9ASTR|nr:unnamed protein product [Lactuca virosa]
MSVQVLQPQSVNGGSAYGGNAQYQLGQVVSVRVCRDLSTRRSLGYDYVNYVNPQDAARAIKVLNFTPLNGKSVRIMYSHRDPIVCKSTSGKIFIKNLDKAIDQKALHDTCFTFGNIISCKIPIDMTSQSKGYGFMQYDTEVAAQQASEKLNGMLLNDKQVYIGPFLHKQERELVVDKRKFTNVFVKNLSESIIDDDLNKTFSEYRTITSAIVMWDTLTLPLRFGSSMSVSPKSPGMDLTYYLI